MYFNDDQMKAVQKFGLRTGVEIKTLNDALLSYDQIVDATPAGTAVSPRNSAQTAAQAQLEALARALALDTASTRFILDQIAGDPYTTFAWDVWCT
jgi:hypothetical protein